MRLFPRTRREAVLRFVLGAVIVVAFSAATTAVAGLLQFKQFGADLDKSRPLKNARVTIADPGRLDDLHGRPGRALLAAADTGREEPRYFLIDAYDLSAHSQTASRRPADLRIPEANEPDPYVERSVYVDLTEIRDVEMLSAADRG